MKEKCKDCKHCIWKNRWVCEFTNWEFDFWIGHCDDYEKQDNRD